MENENFIYGIHPVKETLKINPSSVLELIIQFGKDKTNAKIADIINICFRKNIKIRFENQKFFSNLVKESNHQGILVFLEKNNLQLFDESDLEKLVLQKKNNSSLILILDSIQDPHNLGACIRTADASSVDFIIIPKDKSAKITATVQKISAGASNNVKILIATNLARTLKNLQKLGIWIIGLAGEATKNIYETDFSCDVACVMGSEEKGLRLNTRNNCDFLAKIPMNENAVISSLNVSVATGIVLYEVLRQKNYKILENNI